MSKGVGTPTLPVYLLQRNSYSLGLLQRSKGTNYNEFGRNRQKLFRANNLKGPLPFLSFKQNILDNLEVVANVLARY